MWINRGNTRRGRRRRARRYSSSSSDSSDSYSSSTSSPPPPSTILGLTLMRCMQCGLISDRPLPYPFRCSPSTMHVNCRCCTRAMPVRDDDPTINQKCTLCSVYYCHLYWTCNGAYCLGCLAKFKDINLPNTCLNGILGNAYESNILKEYIEGKGWSVRDFIQRMSELLTSGTLSVTSHGVALTADTVVCKNCAGDLLKRLAFDYRQTIPNDELPVSVTSRMDCYWGKECRTQYTNPSHARKYNHVCEKTRTS